MKKRLLFLSVCILTIFTISGCTKSIEAQVAEQLELGQRYLSEMKYEEAIVTFQKVIELDQKVWDAYKGIAEGYEGQNNHAEAAAYIESGIQVIGLDSISSEDISFLVEIYKEHAQEALAVDDKELVQKIYERILELNEDDGDIRQALDEIKEEKEKFLRHQEEEQQVLEYREDLEKMASSIVKEESYDFNDARILSDEFQNMVKALSEPIFFATDNGLYIGVYPSGYIYYGEMKDGIREGAGRWYYGNLDRITLVITDWSNDLPNGKAEVRTVINTDRIEREEGHTYASSTITYCNVSNGIYDGPAEQVWYMEEGHVHDWDLEYVNGYSIDALGDGRAALCKNCSRATLGTNTSPAKIQGLEWAGTFDDESMEGLEQEIISLFSDPNNITNPIQSEEVVFYSNSLVGLDIFEAMEIMKQMGLVDVDESFDDDDGYYCVGKNPTRGYNEYVSVLQYSNEEQFDLISFNGSQFTDRIREPLAIGIRNLYIYDNLETVLEKLGYKNTLRMEKALSLYDSNNDMVYLQGNGIEYLTTKTESSSGEEHKVVKLNFGFELEDGCDYSLQMNFYDNSLILLSIYAPFD